MSNYLITEQSESYLLLQEKQKSRFGFGLAFLVFGGAISLLASTQIRGISSVGPILGLVLGVLCVMAGIISIIRRGWIRLDQQRQVLEFYGGSRKFYLSARSIEFERVEAIAIRTSISGAHKSHGIVLELNGNSEELLDSTANAEYANSLAEEIARRIGCKFQGHAA